MFLKNRTIKVRFMGQQNKYNQAIKTKEAVSMKTVKAIVKGRKPISFRTSQTLYGISILLTFLAAGRLGALV